MPTLKNRLPKMCEMGKCAVVNYQRRKTVPGKWGTLEAKLRFARELFGWSFQSIRKGLAEKNEAQTALTRV